MNQQARPIDIIWSLDTLAACVVAIVASICLRRGTVPFQIAQELFGVAITLHSILFGVFFAAVAVLVSAGDNRFVSWLQKDNSYAGFLWDFRWRLTSLLVALAFSLILYVACLPYHGSDCGMPYPSGWLIAFSFVTTYALVTTAQGVFDAIRFADRRAEFSRIMGSDLEHSD